MLGVLNTIKDSFLSFFEVVGNVIDFVINLIKDIVYVVKITAEFVAKIPDLIGIFPSAVIAMIVAMFAIVVIYKILGRE